MANPTMTLIGSPIVVGSGGVSSVTFSSIPQTYTDLVIKVSAQTNRSYFLDQLKLTFNGITSGYSYTNLNATASVYSGSGSGSALYVGFCTTTTSGTNIFSNTEIYCPNYISSNPKSVSSDAAGEENSTNGILNLTAGLWSYSGNPAISSINLTMDVGTIFTQYSTFYLYGISNS